MAACLGDGGDDEVPDLAAQFGEVGGGQAPKVGRLADAFEPHGASS